MIIIFNKILRIRDAKNSNIMIKVISDNEFFV